MSACPVRVGVGIADAERGEHVASELDRRVLGIGARTLREVPRRVAVAGGRRKWGAIEAALRGGWVSVLVTDLHTAEELAGRATPALEHDATVTAGTPVRR